MTAQDFLCKAPKLGGAPERKRGRGGSLENHPACSDFFSGFALSGSRFAVLAGTPPNLGGVLPLQQRNRIDVDKHAGGPKLPIFNVFS